MLGSGNHPPPVQEDYLMSCGAGTSRRVASAIKTRGTSRRSMHTARRSLGKPESKRRTLARVTRKSSRRPPGKQNGKRSKASLTAAQTARKHAHMTAHATASAHARATARAHARATARATAQHSARLAHQQFLACQKKLRKSASINQREWRPNFRGRQHRGRRNINPIFR